MLDALFRPRAVAVVGASNNPLSIGHIVVENLKNHAFTGPIYPVNPKQPEILGLEAYPSVLEIPGEVDLVNISIKNTLVPRILEECGQKGVKFAIVHTAGFKEVGGEGIALEKQIVEVAHRHGMRVYGPNSQGVQNSDPAVSLYANFTFVPQKPGNISILAQSGGVGEVLKIPIHNAGMGTRMYASFGNECDVSMNEILRYYGEDEGTKVILVQVETFSDPAGFLEIASEITRKKPILAIKAGRTSEGAVAVSSHTGKLLNQDRMADAMFAKAGIMRFADQDCMVNAAIAFSQQPIARGGRVALVTNTGGPAILALDELIDKGLQLAKLEESTKDHLRQNLYPMASVKNPVDVVATATPEHYGLTVDTLFKDPNVDSVLVNFISAPFVDLMGTADRLKEACATSEKPVVCCLMTIEKWYPLMEAIRHGGTPVYEFPEHAARALVALTEYGKIQGRGADACPRYEVDKAGAAAILEPHRGSGQYLPQADAFQVLACYGLPCPKVVQVDSREAALAAAASEVGYPCVLKVDSTSVVHKSDAGGVALDLGDEAALGVAYDRMAGAFQDAGTRFVLMEQKAPGREVILGAIAQEGLDALVSFGLGGIFVEALQDVIFRLAPLTEREADEMLTAIRGRKILEGVRGQRGVDFDRLRECLIRLSWLVKDFPFIEEMDLNPVFAYEAGDGAAVVDARMKVAGS